MGILGDILRWIDANEVTRCKNLFNYLQLSAV